LALHDNFGLGQVALPVSLLLSYHGSVSTYLAPTAGDRSVSERIMPCKANRSFWLASF
jgi:hypothetical protein